MVLLRMWVLGLRSESRLVLNAKVIMSRIPIARWLFPCLVRLLWLNCVGAVQLAETSLNCFVSHYVLMHFIRDNWVWNVGHRVHSMAERTKIHLRQVDQITVFLLANRVILSLYDSRGGYSVNWLIPAVYNCVSLADKDVGRLIWGSCSAAYRLSNFRFEVTCVDKRMQQIELVLFTVFRLGHHLELESRGLLRILPILLKNLYIWVPLQNHHG